MTSDLKKMASVLLSSAQTRTGPIHGTSQMGALRGRMEAEFPSLREARHAREERELFQQTVIAALAHRRDKVGLNQTQVADAMGTTQSAVSKIESASGDIGLSTLLRYGEAIGFAPTDLFLFLASQDPLAAGRPASSGKEDEDKTWDVEIDDDAVDS